MALSLSLTLGDILGRSMMRKPVIDCVIDCSRLTRLFNPRDVAAVTQTWRLRHKRHRFASTRRRIHQRGAIICFFAFARVERPRKFPASSPKNTANNLSLIFYIIVDVIQSDLQYFVAEGPSLLYIALPVIITNPRAYWKHSS